MTNTYPSAPSLQTRFITCRIDDVSSAGSTWVVPGFSGRIEKITTVLHGAIGTADVDISTEIGGTAVTGGTVTIAYTSSAAGDVDTAEPTAANVFTDEQPLEVITDGASSNAVAVTVTYECVPI